MPAADQQYYRDEAVWYASQWIGRPYIWGGDDSGGFDCSGFSLEIFHALGLVPRKDDYTADGLFNKFNLPECHIPHYKGYGGCFVFWPEEGRKTHVEFMRDSRYVIGASGGGRLRYTLEDLAKDFPYVEKLLNPRAPDNQAPPDNPMRWLATRMLQLWEADRRNAYIMMNKVDYRGGEFTVLDPFKTIT